MAPPCHTAPDFRKDHVSCLSITGRYAERNMELRHLRYYIGVTEEKNVSRAALKLHLSQPALSRQIRDLEDELGFPLLERRAKSVRLTEAGRVFLTEARARVDRAGAAGGRGGAGARGAGGGGRRVGAGGDAGVEAGGAAAAGVSGELHVVYAPSLSARLLPQALRAFQ